MERPPSLLASADRMPSLGAAVGVCRTRAVQLDPRISGAGAWPPQCFQHPRQRGAARPSGFSGCFQPPRQFGQPLRNILPQRRQVEQRQLLADLGLNVPAEPGAVVRCCVHGCTSSLPIASVALEARPFALLLKKRARKTAPVRCSIREPGLCRCHDQTWKHGLALNKLGTGG
jgi:hypothetical protein